MYAFICKLEISFDNLAEGIFLKIYIYCSVALDCDNLNVFYLKYAHPAIFTALNLLFNKMTQCGVITKKFGNGVKTPVVKNASHSLSDVCNFRPVSIISIIAQIFESLISLHFGHLFSSHANQFGFCAERGVIKQFLHLITLLGIFVTKIVMYIYVH